MPTCFAQQGWISSNLAQTIVDFHGPDEWVAISDLVLMEEVVLKMLAAARDVTAPHDG